MKVATLVRTCIPFLLLTIGVRAQQFAAGVDVSFLRQSEQQGVVFKDGGKAKPGLAIFRDHGYNWVRLRLFNNPSDLPNNLAYTIALARDAKKLGFKFLLDFHYSDTWADPGHQVLPKAWEHKTHGELVTAIYEYTRDSITAFREAGVLPDMVQVGNEITAGILWPDGKLPGNWEHFAELIRTGVKGVEAGCGDRGRPKIMLHIDKGGDAEATRWFFDNIQTYGIPFDVIGQSYYPWWQGSLQDLRRNLDATARRYHKPIIVVEAAYNWQPGHYQNKTAPWAETPEGQRKFLADVVEAVRETADGLGAGVFWWEPAVRGDLATRGFFDDRHDALPVLTVFDAEARN